MLSDYLRYTKKISIHALREEGDRGSLTAFLSLLIFLSTPSARRATDHPQLPENYPQISIHALREEGDASNGQRILAFTRFLSTPSARRATDRHFRYKSTTKFLSTPSARRATHLHLYSIPPSKFLSTPSARRATLADKGCTVTSEFLSTPSARRATRRPELWPQPGQISIHALREEGDTGASLAPATSPNFYPRPPRGGRLHAYDHAPTTFEFLSTPSARRATSNRTSTLRYYRISIHALREEGDRRRLLPGCWPWNFYPRPPRGGRLSGAHSEGGREVFLSTPSARRATSQICSARIMMFYFYPRPPRGGRPRSSGPKIWASTFLSTPSARRATEQKRERSKPRAISIHALREEGDFGCYQGSLGNVRFLSTPSARRATSHSLHPLPCQTISIHALREEGDLESVMLEQTDIDFYPRPPRGGRRWASLMIPMLLEFLSTPSARRATSGGTLFCCFLAISIHALREEGDPATFTLMSGSMISIHALREEGDQHIRIQLTQIKDFYPRPPRGGRRGCPLPLSTCASISIHALREEGDRMELEAYGHDKISIHALREEGDPQTWANRPFSKKFLSTPSARRATRENRTLRKRKGISIHALREEGDKPSPMNSKR